MAVQDGGEVGVTPLFCVYMIWYLYFDYVNNNFKQLIKRKINIKWFARRIKNKQSQMQLLNLHERKEWEGVYSYLILPL